MIIDDDVDYCCLMQIAFQEANISRPTEAIHDGWDAIDHLRQFADGSQVGIPPGLILLDLRMPGLSGLEVLRWIRNQPLLTDVPVVVFTGLEACKELSEATASGATSVRAKPFSYRELVHEAAELRDTYLESHELKSAA